MLLGQPGWSGGKAGGEGRQQLLLNRCLKERQPLLCPVPAHCLKREQTNPGAKGYFSQFCYLASPSLFPSQEQPGAGT